MSTTVDAPRVATPDAGVIEEARTRQRRYRWRLALAVVPLSITAILLFALGGGSPSANGGVAPNGQPWRVTVENGYAYANGQPIQIGITPYLRAGWVGLEMTESIRGPGPDLASGLSNYPTQAAPLFGFLADGLSFGYVHGVPESVWGAPVGPAGEIDMLLVGPTVASMRVAHLGTFKPVHVFGLPAGDRAIVFSRPPGAIGVVLAPGLRAFPLLTAKHTLILRETLYNAAGKVVPLRYPTFHAPTKFWAAPAAPVANGRCAARSTLPGVAAQWGQVTTTIAADSDVIGPAFLSCMYAEYRWRGSIFQVGVLVNAQSPGRAPAPLWNATPLAGQSVVEVKPVEYTERVAVKRAGRSVRYVNERHALAPGSVARRVGNAWLVVRGGANLSQRTQFLDGLQVTRLDLSHV
jgi:hypothetical protein